MEKNTLPTIKPYTAFYGAITEQITTKHFEVFMAISKLAATKGLAIYAQGGFAVELAIGHLSRTHDDLDVVVRTRDLQAFKQLFTALGFKIGVHEGKDAECTFYAEKFYREIKASIFVDVDGIDIDGEIVSDGRGADKFVWPINTGDLFWRRNIENITLRFLSPHIVYKFKKMQQKRDQTRAKEIHDFKELESAFPHLRVKKKWVGWK